MNLPATCPALAPAHFNSAIGQPRRIAKAANSKGFGDCLDQFTPQRGETLRMSTQVRACQNGTLEDAPPWNGPALQPAFAAQVLGQAMVDHTARSAGLDTQTYSQTAAHIPAALLLDVSI